MIHKKLRGRLSALALASGLLFSARAEAQQRPIQRLLSSGPLVAAPGILAVRVERAETYGAPPASRRAAFTRLSRDTGEAWQALWDRETDAPVRMFGRGLPAPGAVASAKAASAHARAFLADRIDLIAPGGSMASFQEVANDLDQGLRTVAFIQLAEVAGKGLVPVIGGRASVRYKNDRLFMVASEAYPPGAPLAAPQIDGAAAEITAQAWAAEIHASASVFAGAELCAIPLVGSGRREIRSAYRVEIEATGPRSRYAMYIDAETGRRLAVEQLLRFEATPILFDAPVRAPQLGRANFPARLADVTVDGAALDTDDQGLLTWAAGPGSITLNARGTQVSAHNTHGGPDITGAFNVVNGVPLIWSEAADQHRDAQLSAYIHTNIVKAHAKIIAPQMTFLSTKVSVWVNLSDPQGCNAYWDGTALNFLDENGACNNTARVGDVAYHEFGHGFHQHAVISGAGALDSALGEGGADTMATGITHDSKLAPGFFLGGDTPLRDMASGRRWPDDISTLDPHETGLIYAGAMWDLRGYLRADLGDDEGDSVTNQLYYQSLRRASDIPTTYPEILAADDDDGDLSNGTPHICAINRAFVAHGLASVADEAGLTLEHQALGLVAPGGEGYPIKVGVKLLYPACAATPIDWVRAHLFLPGEEKTVTLSLSGSDYVGEIPAQKDGTGFRYRIEAGVNGHTATMPNNRADDQYSVFVGDVDPIYCDDFESQIDGWKFGDTTGGGGDFQWDSPVGLAGDPDHAYSGTKVIGDRLISDGAYKHDRTVFAESPVVDITGQRHLRLQFRRWLTVQDAAFDQATIYVNDQLAWQNQGTSTMDGSMTHEDLEWRFQDIDLTPYLAHGHALSATTRFELKSDAEVQRGGWNIDDFCVVAWRPRSSRTFEVPTPDSDNPTGGPDLFLSGGCLCASAGGGAPGGSGLMIAIGAAGLFAARRRRATRRRASCRPRR